MTDLIATIFEIAFAALAAMCWLIAGLFFSPWRRNFLAKIEEDARAGIEAIDIRMGRLFSAGGAGCSGIAAISHVIVTVVHLP